MASSQEIQTLVCEALFDDEFRGRLFKSPKKAAAELKITLTRAQIARIKSLEQEEADSVAKEVQSAAGAGPGVLHWARR